MSNFIVNMCDLDSFSGEGRTGLDLPHSVSDSVQIQTLSYLGRRGCCEQVLLICKDQDWDTAQLFFIK